MLYQKYYLIKILKIIKPYLKQKQMKTTKYQKDYKQNRIIKKLNINTIS